MTAEIGSTKFGDYCQTAVSRLKDLQLPEDISVPSLPASLTEFLELADDPDVSLKQLGEVVERDPGLTVDLLKCANYNTVSTGQPIRNATEALTRVGLKKARDYLLAAGVKSSAMMMESKLLNCRNFWNESLQRALFAKHVAEHLNLDADLAFIGGLLQDFALPVLTNQFDDRYLYYLKEVVPTGATLARWEKDTFGWNHAEAAALLAHRWHLPDDLLCSILMHHQIEHILESGDQELFALFPSNVAAMLPDQLNQNPQGVDKLLDVDDRSQLLKLDHLCGVVDRDFEIIAEGRQRPAGLTAVFQRARAARENVVS